MIFNRNAVFRILLLGTAFCFFSCQNSQSESNSNPASTSDQPFITILGIAQDAGYPQINCRKDCCKRVWDKKSQPEKVSCLGIIDPKEKKYWLVDATPDIKFQLEHLQRLLPKGELAGILLTHAHIGHYTGLMELGREAWGATKIPVYAMPRMIDFLKSNGPWNQLVALENIQIIPIEADSTFSLNENISAFPFLVPHREEYSETVGFKILGPKKSGIFIPDIDKWEKWSRDINDYIINTDIAYLDGTFFAADELPGRDMSEIPHPFIEESLQRFEVLNEADREKIFFIHLNHTNRLLWSKKAKSRIESAHFNLAFESHVFPI